MLQENITFPEIKKQVEKNIKNFSIIETFLSTL